MYRTSLRKFVSGTKQKKLIQRHPIIMNDADYDYILNEIECRKKLSLKGMWVLIVKVNCIDDNNNNATFNVFFHYIIIKN